MMQHFASSRWYNISQARGTWESSTWLHGVAAPGAGCAFFPYGTTFFTTEKGTWIAAPAIQQGPFASQQPPSPLGQKRARPLCAMCGRLPVGNGSLDVLSFGRCGHVRSLLMR